MSSSRAGVLRWLLVIAVMAAIFALSSISGLRVSDDAQVDRPFRILGHLGAYALLGGLLLFALSRRSRPRAVQATLAWGIAVLYGVTDEVHQAFVPNRTGRIDDLVVDAIGAGLGVAVAYVVLVTLARAQSRA
jgi:VanZ family protein